MDRVLCQISESMNENLTRAVTEEEVRLAPYQLGGSKAPGPDGFPRMFYQKNWQIVGPDVFTVVRTYVETGKFLLSLNQTDITLQRMVPETPSMDDDVLKKIQPSKSMLLLGSGADNRPRGFTHGGSPRPLKRTQRQNLHS